MRFQAVVIRASRGRNPPLATLAKPPRPAAPPSASVSLRSVPPKAASSLSLRWTTKVTLHASAAVLTPAQGSGSNTPTVTSQDDHSDDDRALDDAAGGSSTLSESVDDHIQSRSRTVTVDSGSVASPSIDPHGDVRGGSGDEALDFSSVSPSGDDEEPFEPPHRRASSSGAAAARSKSESILEKAKRALGQSVGRPAARPKKAKAAKKKTVKKRKKKPAAPSAAHVSASAPTIAAPKKARPAPAPPLGVLSA